MYWRELRGALGTYLCAKWEVSLGGCRRSVQACIQSAAVSTPPVTFVPAPPTDDSCHFMAQWKYYDEMQSHVLRDQLQNSPINLELSCRKWMTGIPDKQRMTGTRWHDMGQEKDRGKQAKYFWASRRCWSWLYMWIFSREWVHLKDRSDQLCSKSGVLRLQF